MARVQSDSPEIHRVGLGTKGQKAALKPMKTVKVSVPKTKPKK